MPRAAPFACSLLFVAGLTHAAKPSAFDFVKVDTSKPATAAEVVALAASMKSQTLGALRGQGKTDAAKQLEKLADPDPEKRHQAAWTLSGVAMVMMGASQNKDLVILLTCAAAEAFPSDAILVNNFGALLRQLDAPKTLAVLLYARGLAPEWPVVLTNLGNTLFELGDDRKAEDLFNQALRRDPHFRDARSGLVLVYLKRREAGRAYAELLKGVEEVTFTEDTAQQFARVKNDGARVAEAKKSTQPLPPPPASPPPSAPRNGKTPDRLVLPPFPDWTELGAFLAAKGPERWEKEISAGVTTESDALLQAARKKSDRLTSITKLPADQQEAAMKALRSAPFAGMAARNAFAMEVMQQYVDARLERIDREYSDASEAIGQKFNASSEVMNDALGKKADALGKAMNAAGAAGLKALPEYQKLLIEYCKQLHQLAEDHFQDWKKLARVHHQKTNELLQEYWVYCEQYLNPLWGDDFERLNHQRSFYVYTRLSVLASEYPARKLGFVGLNGFQDCNAMKPFPPPAADELKTEVPKATAPPCPFEKAKAKGGMGPASVAVDCESIEFEFLEGIGAAVKWNYKNKSLTITPEVGVKGDLSVGKLKVGEFSFKEGVAITFDREGNFPTAALIGEVGASVNLGGAAAGFTANMTVGGTAGIKVEYGRELGLAQ